MSLVPPFGLALGLLCPSNETTTSLSLNPFYCKYGTEEAEVTRSDEIGNGMADPGSGKQVTCFSWNRTLPPSKVIGF
ncbi:hypothetical protein PHLCEN_2v9093 [Hermanssonia centrifuga]|uniref:Uncharacterized protein n=1 Tax=Hermanssonia centrifuga TaxID=98765 RepID=A0A1U7KK12_9APHY|nr:hypothetical protein PHLCEN_2v9093 [Hermanssonia centrifuga]